MVSDNKFFQFMAFLFAREAKPKTKLDVDMSLPLFTMMSEFNYHWFILKDKYPNFEEGLKCILMVNPYLLLCSYIN